MAFRHLWTTSVILLLALLFSTTGCSPLLEKRVELSYQALVRTGGGSGEIFLAQPIEQHNRVPLPGGKWAIGKVDAQLWKNGQLVKTLTVGARAEEEGVDRSSEPIRLALRKTLQTVMQDLVPEIIKVLE